jgi:glutathione S-transferase
MIKLYNYDLSVNCYKQRLIMGLLDIHYESIPVDFFPGFEHKSETFRKVNPLGHIPVLIDGDFVIRDAHAILVYLAAKYDPSGRWYPTSDPELLGEVAQWMLFAEGTTNTASAARLHDNLGYGFDIEELRAGTHRLFRVMDEHLWFREQESSDGHVWLCSAPHPTIADLAVFPDVMLSEEGGISRLDYPALRRWTDQVRRLDRFVPMPGIHPVAPAAGATSSR